MLLKALVITLSMVAIILKCIYIRNSLSFNLSLVNRLMDSNLILAAPILLTLSLSTLLLLVIQLTISYNYPTVTSYCKLVLAILVSSLDIAFKVVTAVNGVITSAFSSILFNFFYYNLGSNYIMEPYRKYYSRFLNRLGIQVQNSQQRNNNQWSSCLIN